MIIFTRTVLQEKNFQTKQVLQNMEKDYLKTNGEEVIVIALLCNSKKQY